MFCKNCEDVLGFDAFHFDLSDMVAPKKISVEFVELALRKSRNLTWLAVGMILPEILNATDVGWVRALEKSIIMDFSTEKENLHFFTHAVILSR